MAKHELTVSELAERSGLPISTIRYYVREGLVPPGRRLSRSRVLYNSEHLDAVATVRSLRAAEVPVTDIRARVAHATDAFSDSALAEARRNDLLDAATGCFLSTGFAGTSLDAIARAASMSKATVYRHFSSKEAIFMACAGRVFNQLYTDVWPAISQTQAPGERLRARWDAFVDSFQAWAPMMHLVRGLAIGNPAFHAEYLRLTATIVAPIARELSMLSANEGTGAESLAYVVMGIAEAAGHAVSEGRHTRESAWRYLESVLVALTGGPWGPPPGPDTTPDVKQPGTG